jgi:hypothetical protein
MSQNALLEQDVLLYTHSAIRQLKESYEREMQERGAALHKLLYSLDELVTFSDSE